MPAAVVAVRAALHLRDPGSGLGFLVGGLLHGQLLPVGVVVDHVAAGHRHRAAGAVMPGAVPQPFPDEDLGEPPGLLPV